MGWRNGRCANFGTNGPNGMEKRTFECLKCHHVETRATVADPIKSGDARSWISGELGAHWAPYARVNRPKRTAPARGAGARWGCLERRRRGPSGAATTKPLLSLEGWSF
jgi:hypothetical protein